MTETFNGVGVIGNVFVNGKGSDSGMVAWDYTLEDMTCKKFGLRRVFVDGLILEFKDSKSLKRA